MRRTKQVRRYAAVLLLYHTNVIVLIGDAPVNNKKEQAAAEFVTVVLIVPLAIYHHEKNSSVVSILPGTRRRLWCGTRTAVAFTPPMPPMFLPFFLWIGVCRVSASHSVWCCGMI